MMSYIGFDYTALETGDRFWRGQLSDAILSCLDFDELWDLHPPEFSEILMHGRRVKTPRWWQAFGQDYRFSGQLSHAVPIPEILIPFLVWSQEAVDHQLNGLLLNWYDGALGHYIGKHRDKTTGMINGSPIVTISLGESRIFRLRRWKGQEKIDFVADHGDVFVIPFKMNKQWTHEVPKSKKYKKKRISITIRAFEEE